MPLILAPSFDDHTRAQVEAFLELVRVRRISAAIEFQQSKLMKLENQEGSTENKLTRAYEQLGKIVDRLDRDIEKAEELLAKCEMLKGEIGLIHDRITLAQR